MKIKLKEILEAQVGLNEVFQKKYDNFKITYALLKTKKAYTSELNDILETRKNLIEKYAEKDKDGKLKVETKMVDGRPIESYIFKDEKLFTDEWNKFIETEIDLDIWLIPYEVIKEVNPSVDILYLISKFIDIEKPVMQKPENKELEPKKKDK